jgi:hypothetical protein
MEKQYNIKITGSGTKEQLTQALQDVMTSLNDVEDDTVQFEDHILYTEVDPIEEGEENE